MPVRKNFRFIVALLGIGVLLLLIFLTGTSSMLAETLKEGFSQTSQPTKVAAEVDAAAAAGKTIRGSFPFLEELGWEIKNVLVYQPGRTAVISEGTLQDDFVILALAVNPNNPDFTTGLVEMSLSSFSPAQDMPGQKAGKWYVHGDWKITDTNATEEIAQYRYGPHTLKGIINLELDYNPLVLNKQAQFLSAPVQFALPGKDTTGQQMQGALIGNTQFNKVMELSGESFDLTAPTKNNIEEGQ